MCSARHFRDDVELVHMTETQRWDDLLKVARAWDAFDSNTRGELETSEEEAEENFLTDGDGMYVMVLLSKLYNGIGLKHINTGLRILRKWEESQKGRSLKALCPNPKHQHHRLLIVKLIHSRPRSRKGGFLRSLRRLGIQKEGNETK